MFLEDKFDELRERNTILNLRPHDRSYFFYDLEAKSKCELIEQPALLVRNIRCLFQRIRAQALSDDGANLDYNEILHCELWKTQFLELISMLPYANFHNLHKDHNTKLATFINLYNLLIIHAILQYETENKNKYEICIGKRIRLFREFKYNIGGHNYSLEDIEHGVLRLNDAFGTSCLKTNWLIVIKRN